MVSYKVGVIYLEKVFQQGDTAAVFLDRKYLYIKMLLSCVTQIDPNKPLQIADELINDEPMSSLNLSLGFSFYADAKEQRQYVQIKNQEC